MKIKLHFFLYILLNISAINILLAQHTGQAEARMKHGLAVLSADSLLGREAGTRGEQMASAYIAASMKSIGLQPRGDSAGSYLDHFVMNYPVIFKDGILKVNNIKFKHVEEFGGTDLSASGTVTAPIAILENALLAMPGELEASGVNVAGKIVAMDINPGKAGVSNQQIVFMVSRRAEFLASQGALAVILHNSAREPYEDALFGSSTTSPLTIPVVYIARLPYERLQRQRKPSGTIAITVERNATLPSNVVGMVDNHAARTVIIGAHYDHLGTKKPKEGRGDADRIFNGADDNGSGTVAMLELARWAAANSSLAYNYIFVAFSGEEKGLFGSKSFASELADQNPGIAYMLNLDMVGRLGCQGDTLSVLGVASSPVWEGLLRDVPHSDFYLKTIMGAPAFSDHAPFMKKNIPVIYFTSGLHKDYHTPADEIAKINFGGMSEIVDYLKLFITAAEKVPDIPFQKIKPLQQTRALITTF